MGIFTRSKVVVPFSGAHCESTGPHSLFLKTEMASFLWGQSLSARKSRECTVCFLSFSINLLGKCSLATVRGSCGRDKLLAGIFIWGAGGLNQALIHAKQVLYKLSYIPSPAACILYVCGLFVFNRRINKVYYLNFHFMCMCFAAYMSMPCACLVPTETRRRQQISRNWSYRQ